MMHNDFVAVKVGDVNNSAQANAAPGSAKGWTACMMSMQLKSAEEAERSVKLNFADNPGTSGRFPMDT